LDLSDLFVTHLFTWTFRRQTHKFYATNQGLKHLI